MAGGRNVRAAIRRERRISQKGSKKIRRKVGRLRADEKADRIVITQEAIDKAKDPEEKRSLVLERRRQARVRRTSSNRFVADLRRSSKKDKEGAKKKSVRVTMKANK